MKKSDTCIKMVKKYKKDSSVVEHGFGGEDMLVIVCRILDLNNRKVKRLRTVTAKI